MDVLGVILWTVAGTLCASIVSLMPALHIYNVSGILIILTMGAGTSTLIPMPYVPVFMMAMVVGWAILNTVPALFLGAPDESAIFVVLPGQKYMMQGRGYEAAALTGIGALAGILAMLAASPVFFRALPKLRHITRPHLFWIMGLIITYMLMSEWPKGSGRQKTGWGRFIDGWKNLGAGLLTFLLSGILGFIILNKPIIPIQYSFQNIMPVFVGLFAIPWVLGNIFCKTEIPPQYICRTADLDVRFWSRGGFGGFLGGMIAAFLPVVTGGIGGFIAGHATAQRDDRLFIISQGASKSVYYIGSFLLAFVPGLELTRGGMAWMLRPFTSAHSYEDYWRIMGVIMLSGGISFFLLLLYSRLVIRLINRINYRSLSVAVLFILLAVVWGVSGIMGLALMFVGTGIGLLPVYYHSRRMNCMGVLLLPITLNMGGVGQHVARFMGLV
ncbi:MAG: tripartite tricarboxylate transporter permease [bacterium]|nr:tripartite tricarboxylate transporter permease [bacterium]